jgi:crossover junction endodeoxyribonuclease RuvC
MLVPALAGLRVEEYAPNAIKKAVVGVGHASKEQIKYMVKLHFPKIQLRSVDSTDALAVAICHSNHLRNSMKMHKKLLNSA